jgi:hypothetical protein
MKQLIALITCLFTLSIGFAQNCETVSLKTDEEAKAAEPCVIKAADYALSKPLHNSDVLVSSYRQFIIAWMTKTPDYSFTITSKVADLCKDDANVLLFGIYNTCMAKAALQNKSDFGKEGIKLLVDYIKKKDNGVAQTAKVKKLLADYEKGDVKKYYEQ